MQGHRLRLELYSRPGCHLGNDLRALCERLAAEVSVDIVEINIEAHPDLFARHAHEVPVLFVDGRKAVRFRTSERELRRILRWQLLRRRVLGG
jgi:hypothetical protein